LRSEFHSVFHDNFTAEFNGASGEMSARAAANIIGAIGLYTQQ
jgi:hypothetical protein